MITLGFIDVEMWRGSTVATPNVAGVPVVDPNYWKGGAIPTPNVTGEPLVDANHWKGGAIPSPNVTGEPLADVNHWRGTQPNVLISGRVDAVASVVSDKTGYSLTAASYSVVKVVATQLSIAVNNGNTTGTAVIPTVDTTRAIIIPHGFDAANSNDVHFDFSDSTHVRATRPGTTGNLGAYCAVIELH